MNNNDIDKFITLGLVVASFLLLAQAFLGVSFGILLLEAFGVAGAFAGIIKVAAINDACAYYRQDAVKRRTELNESLRINSAILRRYDNLADKLDKERKARLKIQKELKVLKGEPNTTRESRRKITVIQSNEQEG